MPPKKVGGIIHWAWHGGQALGQGDFDVIVQQLDNNRRFFQVATLSGHTLAAYRDWRVIDHIGSKPNVYRLETVALEHPALISDYIKNGTIGENLANHSWAVMLSDAAQLADPAGFAKNVGSCRLVGFEQEMYPDQRAVNVVNSGVKSSSWVDIAPNTFGD